MVIIVEVAGFV